MASVYLLVFLGLRSSGVSVLFLWRKTLNPSQRSVPKDVDVNMPSVLVISLLERSCLNNNILARLVNRFSNVDLFAQSVRNRQ